MTSALRERYLSDSAALGQLHHAGLNGLPVQLIGIERAAVPFEHLVKQFGVSPTSAIRWYESFAQKVQVAPKTMGGDQRSQTIEAQADLIRHLEIPLPYGAVS